MKEVNIYLYTEYSGTFSSGIGKYHYILETICEKDGEKIPVTLKKQAICKDITRNRLELLVLVKALEHMKRKSNIKVFTKSDYLTSSYRSWLDKWNANNFKSKGKEIKHSDLWKEIARQRELHSIEIVKVDKTEYSNVQRMELKREGVS